MMILANTLAVLCLVLLPILKINREKPMPTVCRHNHDTINARYAVNDNGDLEEISNDKVQDCD